MRKIRLTLAGISSSFIATALLMLFCTSAFAADPSTSPQVGANVQGGTTVTADASDASIQPFTLDGTTKDATYTLPITVVDNRGSGAGWSLTMTSTTFSDGTHSLANDASIVTGISLAAVDGSVPVASSQSIVTAIPADTTAPTPVKIFSAAAASGMGTSTVTPTVHIDVPASTYAGNYTSTITLGTNLVP